MCDNNKDIDIKDDKMKETTLPYRDLTEAKIKTDILLNICDDDKKKLINLNSWAVKAFDLSIMERIHKKNLRVKQCEVWSIDFGENIGAEMNKTRPCIILSCDEFNGSSLVTVIPITNNDTNFPSQVKVDDIGVGNYLTGTAKAEQIRTVSKARLGKRICEVSDLNKGIYLLQEALMKHIGIDKEFIEIFDACTKNNALKDILLQKINEFKK